MAHIESLCTDPSSETVMFRDHHSEADLISKHVVICSVESQRLGFLRCSSFLQELKSVRLYHQALMCGSFWPFFCVSHQERLSLFLTSHLSVLMDCGSLDTGFKTKQKKENQQIKLVCFHNMEYSSIKLDSAIILLPLCSFKSVYCSLLLKKRDILENAPSFMVLFFPLIKLNNKMTNLLWKTFFKISFISIQNFDFIKRKKIMNGLMVCK